LKRGGNPWSASSPYCRAAGIPLSDPDSADRHRSRPEVSPIAQAALRTLRNLRRSDPPASGGLKQLAWTSVSRVDTSPPRNRAQGRAQLAPAQARLDRVPGSNFSRTRMRPRHLTGNSRALSRNQSISCLCLATNPVPTSAKLLRSDAWSVLTIRHLTDSRPCQSLALGIGFFRELRASVK